MLNIQKTVLLLSNEHLAVFREYLEENNSMLSLKLVNHVYNCGQEQPDSDELCKMVYGDSSEKSKKKFFQLAHHTFKLTSFLAKKYPFYLAHNLSKIGKLVHSDQKRKAHETAVMVLDVATKVEDFNTQIGVLKFLSQEAFMLENIRKMVEYHQQLNEVLEAEQIANDMYVYMRQYLNFKDKTNLTEPLIDQHVSYFKQYQEHASFSIRIISKYGEAFTRSYLDDKLFYSDGFLEEIITMQKELDKHAYVIFPFADDIQVKIDYMYLKHRLYTHDGEFLVKESLTLLKKYQDLQFWSGYVNMAQIMALSIMGSHFATKYCMFYRDDLQEIIPSDAREKIDYLLEVCGELLEQLKWEDGTFVRYINLNNIYSMLLMLGTEADQKKAVRTIEGLLINYQQISFQKLYDSIFATLILGYFALKDYTAVQDTYKRYEKLTANKVRIAENDLTIKAFYYIAQWISTQRKQYLEKLAGVIRSTEEHKNLGQTRLVIEQAVEYFKIPLPVQK